MKTLFSLLLVLVTLQGCTSIKQPVASRPLVEQNFSNIYQVLPESIWDKLQNTSNGELLSFNSQQVELGRLFFSASGNQCRQLTFTNNLLRVACRVNESTQWYLVKPVISEYIESSSNMETK
jgi:hypothetical protein